MGVAISSLVLAWLTGQRRSLGEELLAETVLILACFFVVCHPSFSGTCWPVYYGLCGVLKLVLLCLYSGLHILKLLLLSNWATQKQLSVVFRLTRKSNSIKPLKPRSRHVVLLVSVNLPCPNIV